MRSDAHAAWQDSRVPFSLRAATVADIDGLLGLWHGAAENAGRPPETREAVTALLGQDPDADRFKALGATRVDAMVLDSNDLGQNLWRPGVTAGRTTGAVE